MSKWDNYWEHGHSRIGDYLLNSARDKALSMLKDLEIKTVLDVGCGSGETLSLLYNNGYDIVGLDSSLKAASMCKSKGLTVHRSSIEDNLLISNQFDLVFSEGMLEHFSDFSKAAKEMARITKSYIMLIQPNHSSVYHRMQSVYFLFSKNHVKEYNYKIHDFDSIMGFYGLTRVGFEKANMFWILLYKCRSIESPHSIIGSAAVL